MLKLFLFGQPNIQLDGKGLSLSRRKSLALLAYLAVTGRPASRDFLAALFWPENNQSSARSNLRRGLFELNQTLGAGVLAIEHEAAAIHPGRDVWVDVCEFTTRVEFARQHPQHQPSHPPGQLCADCAVQLAAAAALYTADFMAGFSLPDSREFDDWQFFEADALRQSLAESLQRLIDWHSERDEYEAAIRFARRWLALDPLHEPAHRVLMSLYAASGQQAAALRQYQECARLLQTELGIELESETAALYDAIRTRRLTRPAGAALSGQETLPKPGFVRNNLPLRSAPLVGREVELARIVDCLRDQPESRLLTLSGPGGIGKTSLAIEAAFRLIDDPDCPFCDGVYFVPLAALSLEESMIEAVAAALQLHLVVDPAERPRQLVNFLQPKRLLLLLDNFEQLINPASIRLVVDLLGQAPQVKLLVTSRERLNAHLERLLPLDSLEVPAPGIDLAVSPVDQTVSDYSAVQLFTLRAQAVKPDFILTASSLEAVIRICQLVHGLPLGIELAAAWLEVLSPAEIAAEIKTSLDFLAASWPDRPERHHSLRAMFDSSWRLLAEAERRALMTLTLFQGSFTRQAAQAVSGAALSLLLALQNKSWLHYTDDGRYQIHELLRQYTAEQLQADPAAWALAREHFAGYYAGLLADLGERIKGFEQDRALDAIAVDFESIRLAWQILVETGKVALAVEKMSFSLALYAEIRLKFSAIKPLLEMAEVEAAQEPWITATPGLLVVLLSIEVIFHPYGDARYLNSFLTESQDASIRRAWGLIAGSRERLEELGYWGSLISFLAYMVDQPGSAASLGALADFFRRQNRPWELARTLFFLAALDMYSSNYSQAVSASSPAQEEARRLYAEALAIFRQTGDRFQEIMTLQQLGLWNSLHGNHQEAIAFFQTSLEELEKTGETILAKILSYGLVDAFAGLGDFTSAFYYTQTMRQSYLAIGDKTRAAHVLATESLLALRHDTLEHARRTRLECLSFYLETDTAYGAAWANWEMGDLERFGGDLAAARDWFEKSRVLFERLDERGFPAFYQRGLGDLAQMVGDYPAARDHFSNSLALAQECGHTWAQTYALCGLGRAEVTLGQPAAARDHFSQALPQAKTHGADILLICLAGCAGLFASIGEAETAVELAALVIANKFSWNETRAQMAALLASLDSLPPARMAAAQERGRALDVAAGVARCGL